MIEKMASGRHKGYWQVRVQLWTKEKTLSSPRRYVKTKTEAKKLEAVLKAELYKRKEERSVHQEDQPFVDVLSSFIEKKKESWSVPTYSSWRFTLVQVEKYMPHKESPVNKITFTDISDFARAYKSDRHLEVIKDGVLSRRLQHLRTFFRAMQINPSPVPASPLKAIFTRAEMTVSKRKQTILTNGEIKQLKDKIFDDLKTLPIKKQASRAFLLVLLDTGMRPEEAQALRWQDLSLEEGKYTFLLSRAWSEKARSFTLSLKGRMRGETHRTLPLSQETYDFLVKYKEAQMRYMRLAGISSWGDLLFPVMTDYKKASEGIPITQTSPRLLLHDLCKELGFEKRITLYTCRHTVASKWASSGDWAFVADRLGNSVGQLQRTYIHASQDPAEIRKLLASQDA